MAGNTPWGPGSPFGLILPYGAACDLRQPPSLFPTGTHISIRWTHYSTLHHVCSDAHMYHTQHNIHTHIHHRTHVRMSTCLHEVHACPLLLRSPSPSLQRRPHLRSMFQLRATGLVPEQLPEELCFDCPGPPAASGSLSWGGRTPRACAAQGAEWLLSGWVCE